MPFTVRSQRDAIAVSLGWDRSDLDEYQPTRPRHRTVKLFNVGAGFGVAVKSGCPLPASIAQEFEPWHLKESLGGWDIYLAGQS